MTYRTLLCAGAALGLLAGAGLAQVGQQQRPGQQQPGQQMRPMAQQGQQILEQLEGSWNVRAEIYDLQALTMPGQQGMRPGERPGVQPGQRPGQPGVGQQPGQPGQQGQQQQVQQIRQQIQQAFTRAGASAQEAQQHAQRLAQQFVQQRPEQQQLQQQLQQAMTQAGVPAQQAQTEAQRLAQQIHQTIQRERRDDPGIDPRRDETAPPVTPRNGQVTRPGQPGQPGMRPQVQFEAEGTATRSWKFNELILEEELRFTIDNGENNNPQHQQQRQQLGQQHVDLEAGDEFEAYGLFAYEAGTGDLSHVWATNTRSKLHYSFAKWDSAQQAMVFYTIDADRIQMPQTAPGRPGVQPQQRQQQGGPQVQPGQQQDRPGTQPGQDRPGMQDRDRPGVGMGQQFRLDAEGTRTVLRIIDEDEHIVEIYQANPTGRAELIMQLTFTRN